MVPFAVKANVVSLKRKKISKRSLVFSFHFEEAKKFEESLMKLAILDWDQPRCYLVLFSIKRDP